MIKHDPQLTGRSEFRGPQTPNIIWTKDLNNGIFSGPVIDENNNLYFGSYYQLDSSDYFYSYTSDGQLRWEKKLSTNRPPQSGILVDSNQTIYFGSLDQMFYSMSDDGNVKWKLNTSHITEIVFPNIDLEGNIYITNNPESELLCINPEGTINWKIKYDEGFLQKSPAFAPDGNTIYIFGSNNNLYALDLNGDLIWKFECGRARKAPLIDNEGNIYFIADEIPQKLYSIYPTGNVRWEIILREHSIIKSYSSPTIDRKGNLYVAYGSSILSHDYFGGLRWWYIVGSNPDEYDEFWQPLICDRDGTIYVGSTFGKYYYAISSEGELKWKLPLNGYQVDNTGAIANDGTLYIGVHKSSLWNQHEKSLIAIRDTNITDYSNSNNVEDFCIFQNYPNPFNPVTTINYSIPRSGFITLKVYDILGKEIMILVNEEKHMGTYKVKFDGSKLSSGIYVYAISLNGKRLIKKMQLIK